MNLQYITDIEGHKNAMQVPLKGWEQIQEDLEALERLRNKKRFLTKLATEVVEIKQNKEGKIQALNSEDFR